MFNTVVHNINYIRVIVKYSTNVRKTIKMSNYFFLLLSSSNHSGVMDFNVLT